MYEASKISKNILKIKAKMDERKYEEALKSIDQSFSLIKNREFYSIKAFLYKHKADIDFFMSQGGDRKPPYVEWAFNSFICLSKNYIQFIESYQKLWIEQLKSIECDFTISLLKHNPLPSIYYFPLEIDAGFTSDVFIADKKVDFEMFLLSYFSQELVIKEVTFYFNVKGKNKISEMKLVVANELIIKPQTIVKKIKEFMLENDKKSIKLDHYSFKIDNVKFILPYCLIKKELHKEKMKQITDISGYYIEHQRPELPPITNIPYPIKFSIIVGKDRPDCKLTCFVKYIENNKPYNKSLVINAKSGKSDSGIINIEKDRSLTLDCLIYVEIQSQGAPVKKVLEEFKLSFLEPFLITHYFYDENNHLLQNKNQIFNKKRTIVVSKCKLSINTPVIVNDICINDKLDIVEASVIPFKKTLAINPNESFSIATILKSAAPLSKPVSPLSLSINYSPKKCFEGDFHAIFKLPEVKIIPNIIDVSIEYNTISYQYHPHTLTVNIKNETAKDQTINFSIDKSDVILIEGPINYDLDLTQNEEKNIIITYFASVIGEIEFPLIKITKDSNVLWQSSPNLYVMFSK